MGFIGKQPSKAAITSSDITDGIVTADKLASDSVTTAKIADNGVTTAKINADAVTDAKIADDVVGTEHLTAGEVDTTALGADAVTAAKIADDAISEEHLDATVITGMTELAATPADTDEFLISDAGTLKRIDYSYIKGGGIENAQQFYASAGKTASSGTNTVLDQAWTAVSSGNAGVIGSSSNVTISSGVFSFATTGIYLIAPCLTFYLLANRNSRYVLGKIEITLNNGSSYAVGSQAYQHINSVDSNPDYASVSPYYIFDVEDTTNHKFRLTMEAAEEMELEYGSNSSTVSIIRLGDT